MSRFFCLYAVALVVCFAGCAASVPIEGAVAGVAPVDPAAALVADAARLTSKSTYRATAQEYTAPTYRGHYPLNHVSDKAEFESMDVSHNQTSSTGASVIKVVTKVMLKGQKGVPRWEYILEVRSQPDDKIIYTHTTNSLDNTYDNTTWTFTREIPYDEINGKLPEVWGPRYYAIVARVNWTNTENKTFYYATRVSYPNWHFRELPAETRNAFYGHYNRARDLVANGRFADARTAIEAAAAMNLPLEEENVAMLRVRIPVAQAAAEANARAAGDRDKLRRAEEMLAAGNAADAESVLLEINRGATPAFRPEEFQRLDDANRRLYALRRGGS